MAVAMNDRTVLELLMTAVTESINITLNQIDTQIEEITKRDERDSKMEEMDKRPDEFDERDRANNIIVTGLEITI